MVRGVESVNTRHEGPSASANEQTAFTASPT